jgi:gliding motility-associated-like protein
MYSNVFELCAPGTFVFSNSSTPISEIDSVIIHWGDNSDTTIQNFTDAPHIYSSPGIWDVVLDVVSNYGCLYTDTFPNIVQTNQPPIANFYISPNPTTTFATHVNCNDWTVGVPIQWQWVAPDATPGISNQQDPWFTYPEIEGVHPINLTVTDANGCWDTITIQLIIEHEMLIFVPNSFTPGGTDEFNNVFKWTVLGIDESQFNLSIYNRWGEIIWETNDPHSTWDGTYNNKACPTGAYAWILTATNKLDAGKKTFTGTLNIIK